MTSQSYGEGDQGSCDDIAKALVIKRVRREGVKIFQICVTSFKDDPKAYSKFKKRLIDPTDTWTELFLRGGKMLSKSFQSKFQFSRVSFWNGESCSSIGQWRKGSMQMCAVVVVVVVVVVKAVHTVKNRVATFCLRIHFRLSRVLNVIFNVDF